MMNWWPWGKKRNGEKLQLLFQTEFAFGVLVSPEIFQKLINVPVFNLLKNAECSTIKDQPASLRCGDLLLPVMNFYNFESSITVETSEPK